MRFFFGKLSLFINSFAYTPKFTLSKDDLQQASETLGAIDYAKLASGAQKLLAPHEMGELFKFIAFIKNAPSLIGFTEGDRKRQL